MRLTPKGAAALAIAVIVLSLGCDGLLGASDDRAKTEDRVKALEKEVQGLKATLATLEARKDSGRYQIVNPVPAFLRNTMLLDTITGRTWLSCTITDENGRPLAGAEGSGWCDMSQADGREERK